MDDGIEIKAHIYLKKAEIDFSNRGLMAPKARVSTEGDILASGIKISGKFETHFDLTDEEFEILMKMFQDRSLEVLRKKKESLPPKLMQPSLETLKPPGRDTFVGEEGR